MNITDSEESQAEYTDDDEIIIRCPISLDIMQHPVVAEDGHSYENHELNNYFDRTTSIKSPLTSEKMSNTLIPNRNLEAIINYHRSLRCRSFKQNDERPCNRYRWV